ncbi:hypothetical protein [Planktothricoides raciborskii]|uniref:Uncharacterized protein n=1 Tax=Planktothricoides raciborskii FACHB-1370 TaxID=2949576 RepID=A0ABR8EAU2_9CYAN|nr:hypothetical protein [Planktothricoides raciborskii]MBD2542717.1 hypothetical protein [Planktothricoides raciborskii FACHB-1370]MBD2581536.1 hypothetical protein [Planktothricoides raciborskii FACHB-1261]
MWFWWATTRNKGDRFYAKITAASRPTLRMINKMWFWWATMRNKGDRFYAKIIAASRPTLRRTFLLSAW